MLLPVCRHIKTNGLQCLSPAMRESVYCYFHTRLHQRHAGFRHTPDTAGYLIPGQHIQLNALEDRESVQTALSVVINALATGQLDTKRATALLYGLQLAASNAAHLSLEPYAIDVVRTIEPSRDGLDLAAPGAYIELVPYDPAEDEDKDEDEDEPKDPAQLEGNQS